MAILAMMEEMITTSSLSLKLCQLNLIASFLFSRSLQTTIIDAVTVTPTISIFPDICIAMEISKGNNRRNLEFTLGEIDIDATLTSEDYTAIDFIVRNLGVANDYEKDSSYGIQTRKKMAEMTSMQICFYLFCILKAFLQTKEAPSILVFGTGFVGSRLLKDLIAANCTQYLKIFCRNDEEIPYWKQRGIKISTSMRKLYPNQTKPHIIILCTPLSSFPIISKQIKHLIDRNTVIIYTTVGLLRRRVYETFHTPMVFRTYQEPEKLSQTIKTQTESTSEISYENANAGLIPKKPEKDERSVQGGNISLIDAGLTSEELAADNIANRAIDIRNLVYMIENYYALCGMSHAMARYETLLSIFAYNDVEYETYLREQKISENFGRREAIESIMDKLYEDDDDGTLKSVKNILRNLSSSVGQRFQRQFSKLIKVVNLPRIHSIIERMNELNYRASIDQKSTRRYSESLLKRGKGYNRRSHYDGNLVEMHSDNFLNKIFDQDRKYLDNHDADMLDNNDEEEMNLHRGMTMMLENMSDSLIDQDEYSLISQRLEREARDQLQNRIIEEELEEQAAEQIEHDWLMSTVDQLLAADSHDVDYQNMYHDA
jgi:hypothetical protein